MARGKSSGSPSDDTKGAGPADRKAEKAVRHVSSISFTRGFSTEVLNQIANCAKYRQFKKDEIVFHRGGPATAVYIVVSGTLKMYRETPDGRERTLALLIGGDTWGEEALAEIGIHECSCIALEEGGLFRVDRYTLENLVRAGGEVAVALLRAAASRIKDSKHEVDESAFRTADCKLARSLLDLATRRGHAVMNGIEIDLPLSHKEIAELVGVRGEDVKRGFQRFQSADLLETSGSRFIIKGMSVLEDLALG